MKMEVVIKVERRWRRSWEAGKEGDGDGRGGSKPVGGSGLTFDEFSSRIAREGLKFEEIT